MQRLLSELRRLFLLPGAMCQDPRLGGSDLQDASLHRQLAGQEAAAVPLLDEQGRTRFMMVGFHGVPQGQGAAHCSAMLQLGKALMEELGLPEPAFSVNGQDGFDLWLPLAIPVPLSEAGEFLGLLKDVYLKGLPAVRLLPTDEQPASAGNAGPVLPPALHPGTGLWSVFIAPGLAPSFVEEAGIDVPPNLDKQAELLAQLEPIAPDAFRQALQALRQRMGGEAVPAPALAAGRVPPSDTGTAATRTDDPPTPAALAGRLQGCVPGALAGQRARLFRALAWPARMVATPFPGLNHLLHGGFQGGRLYALLGPAKSGKTTLASSWLEQAAASGHPSLYMGYEMAQEQFVHAAIARRLRLDARRIEARTLTENEAERVVAVLDAYLAREGRHLEIREAGPASGLVDIAAWVRMVAAEMPACTPLVVIDPFPLASAGLPGIDAQPSTLDRAAALAAACKDLARTTGAAVVVLSALCRAQDREADLEADPDAQALLRAADGVLALQARMPALQDSASQGDTHLARIRLQLLSHRGHIGEVALNHWRAFHLMEEVPGAEPEAAAVAYAVAADAALKVFRRYADATPASSCSLDG